jgi:hypothetical protein
VQGAREWGGIPRPIIPSGGPMGWPPIPWDIIPWGGGPPPPLRCIGWWPFMWWWGPIGPIPFMGWHGPPMEGGQPPFIGGIGRSWKENFWELVIL